MSYYLRVHREHNGRVYYVDKLGTLYETKEDAEAAARSEKREDAAAHRVEVLSR